MTVALVTALAFLFFGIYLILENRSRLFPAKSKKEISVRKKAFQEALAIAERHTRPCSHYGSCAYQIHLELADALKHADEPSEETLHIVPNYGRMTDRKDN